MKPNILMIETSGFGGLAYYTYCLCDKLSAFSDISINLLTNVDYELADYQSNYKIIQTKLKSVPYLSAIIQLCGIVKQERPDLIHVQSILTARKDWLIFLLANLFQIPVVFTSHNVFPHDEEERTAFGMKFAFGVIHRRSKAIITHSESNRSNLISQYNLKNEKIATIKHGNYLFQTKGMQRFSKAEARRKLGLNSVENVCLFFGTVREYKGVMDLLLAVKGLSVDNPKLRLIIAGKAPDGMTKKIESFISDNHLQHIILFENRYIDLKNFAFFFDACDVAILPYLHTYGSGALQTAMAFSKPIIITDLPFFREIVVDGENGFFFNQGDIKSLSKRIIDFFSLSKEKQALMGQASLSIAKDKFDWTPIAEKTIALYRQLLSF